MTHVQLGRGMSDREIAERLVASFSDKLTEPVHFIPAIKILPPVEQWPRRGIIGG